MNGRAETVLTRTADVERLLDLLPALPSLARVRITMRDGRSYVGTIVERPAAQQFLDRQGQAGINALVRLDDPEAPPWTIDLWLSDVVRVERLDPSGR